MKVLSDILHKAGILQETPNSYSSGGYSVLVRNSSSGKFETIPSSSILPSQSGNAGKYLTTDGTVASWGTIDLSAYVPTSRTITINGTSYDLSTNRSWSILESDTLDSVTDRGNTTTNLITIGGISSNGGGTTVFSSETNYFYSNRVSSSGAQGFKIKGYGTDLSFWRYDDGTGFVEFGNAQNYGLKFYTNNTSQVQIHNSGNVSIGSSVDAGYKFDVNGTARVQTNLNVGHLDTNIAVIDARSTSRDITLYVDNTRSTGTNYAGIFQASGTANNIAGYFNATYGASNVSIKADYGDVILNNASGTTTIGSLSGTGTRMVVASSSGVLSTQSITVGTVTSVGLTSSTTGVTITNSPITSSGSLNFEIATASGSANGLLSSTDWTTFNNKQNALTNPVTGTGTSGQVAYWSGTNTQTGSNNLFWDAANNRLGVGTNAPISDTEISGVKTSVSSGILTITDSGAISSGNGGNIIFRGQYNSGSINGGSIAILKETSGGTNYGFHLALYARQGASAMSERLRLTANGNVLIQSGGTFTDGGQRLQVQGTTLLNGVTTIGTINAATTDTDKFLVSDSGVIKYRTGSELLSDIGGQAALTNPITGTGASGQVAYWSGTNTQTGSNNLFWDNTTGRLGIGTNAPASPLNVIGQGRFQSTELLGAAIRANNEFGFNTIAQIASRAVFYGFYNAGTHSNVSIGIGGNARIHTAIQAFNNSTNVASPLSLQYYGGNVIIGDYTADGGQRLQVTGTTLLNGLTTISGSTTAATAIARGANITSTLVAAANNDVLVGLDINPTFTLGAFTGVSSFGLRVQKFSQFLEPLRILPTSLSTGVFITSANDQLDITGNSNTNAWDGAVIKFTNNGGKRYDLQLGSSTSNTRIGANAFGVYDFSASSARFVISTNGNTLLGTTTDAGYRLDVNGTGRFSDNLLVSANRNTGTYFQISNTTSGTEAQSYIVLTSDASSGNAQMGKYSTTTTAYKILASKDTYLYNTTTGGDIAILNDFATGAIKFAAGGSSTAHVTIGTTGLTTFATGVDYKRLNPTTVTTASTATLTPDISAGDQFTITAQAAALSVANPTGTPVNGQKMMIRIKDNGTARAITWSGTQYRASSDLALPTTTVINKTMYLGFIWNSTDSKWDMLAFLNNF